MKKPGRTYTGDEIARLSFPSQREIDDLTDSLRKHLRDKGPLLQGAALAELVSMYLAAHAPMVRAAALDVWIDTMRKMIPEQEKRLIEHYGGKPEGWDPN